jgi:hypothetical protein
MAKTPLFSTYRQGENRVTSSIIAVLERVDLGVVERLLGSAVEESSLAFVTFANQVVGEPGSVPDAAIEANFRYLFEVKTTRDTTDKSQLIAHLKNLGGTFRDERLFVITPDIAKPRIITELDDARVSWFNFAFLSQAIDGLLADTQELVSEQTRFLLRELQALFSEDGLLDPGTDVVVVAAGRAYGFYLEHSAYLCQPGRSFREGIGRLGFYAQGAIQREIPRIIARRDNVDLKAETADILEASSSAVDVAVGGLVRRLVEKGLEGTEQVFVLSPHDSDETLILSSTIHNTKKSHSGRPVAWTMGQTYTRSGALEAGPVTTDQLEALGG